MPEGNEPPERGKVLNPGMSAQDIRTNNHKENQSRTTTQVVAGQAPPQPTHMKPYAQIIQEAKDIRNILEVKITKTSNLDPDATTKKDSQLSFDAMADFLFSTLNIDPALCLAFNHSLGNYNFKELSFKPGVPIDSYVGTYNISQGPATFSITTKKQQSSTVRLTFRNCPLNIPDQELLHIATTFCSPVDNIIHYETITNTKAKGLRGGTRYMEVELRPNVIVPNFFWLAGPLDGDQGARVTVLHGGAQARQCFNCLKIGSECLAEGQGKICAKEMKTPRARMVDYVETLRSKYSYASLKVLHSQQWPAAGSRKKPAIPEFDELVDQEEDDEARLEESLREKELQQIDVAEKDKAGKLLQQVEEVKEARAQDPTQTEKLQTKIDQLKVKEVVPSKSDEVKIASKTDKKSSAVEQKNLKKKMAEKEKKNRQDQESVAQALEMLSSPDLIEENIALILKTADLQVQVSEDGQMVLAPSTFLQTLEARVRREKPNLKVGFEETKNLITLRLLGQDQGNTSSNSLSRSSRRLSSSRGSGSALPVPREPSGKRKSESEEPGRQTKPRPESVASPEVSKSESSQAASPPCPQ